MERNRSVILTLLILTFYVIVEVQWAQASVTSSSCISGEILNGSSGFFSSPNFPNEYPQYSSCTWNITVPNGYIIKVSFLHFFLGGAQLTITNVASSGGVFDGYSLPDPVYSVGNSIQVTFISRARRYSGFNASYTSITYESLCPNLMTLNDTSGTITSPYFPRYYPDNQTCSWQITARKGNFIVLLIEYMNIDPCGAACDYLEISNGLSSDGVSSARRCSYSLRNTIYHVYHDSLKVLFVSVRGGWYMSHGFNATYTQVNYSSIPATCISGEFLYTGSSGSFSSPNFPNNYPQYSRCTWYIAVPSGYIIKISFLHFQLGSRWRGGAQLTITNVPSGAVTLDGNSLPDPVYSVGNSIQVTFISRAIQHSGFNASYTAITYESLCPNLMTLNDKSGVITSPYYPRQYGDIYHACSWQITASKGNYIVLVIENLNIEPCGAACTCDYLEIQNGLSSDGISSARRCGYHLWNVIYYVYHDSLKVLFVSNRGGGSWYRGFKATYTQLNYASIPATCISGELLNGSSGFFASPNFPNNYPNYSRCTWNIAVPSGYIIKISFLHFQLDYRWRGGAQLTITNVPYPSGVVTLKAYSRSYPVYSVENSIQVTFMSRTNYWDSGFNASYTAITYESLCPNLMTLNDTSGTITSPYYPREYSNNQVCSWQITARKGNYIVLLIENMYIKQCGAACTCDYLEIQNGLSSDGVSSARRCGYLRNVTYHVYNDSLKVLFVSNRYGSWYMHRGFKATYTQVNYTTIPANLPTFSLLALAETEAVVQLVNRKTLSNGNTVRYFQIIVIPLKKGTGSGNHPEIIKRKYEDQEEGEPYITAEFLKDESRTTFTVGDGMYYSQFDLIEAVTKYLNGKLESNTQYAVFQRSFDEDGGYENEGIVQFTTKAKGFPTVIVVSVVVVLLFLPILAGTFIVWRRIHRHSQNEINTSLMNLQHCSTQGWMEMSANINTSID